MDLNKLAEIYYSKLREGGYVWIDFNLAVLCNLELMGVKTKLEFDSDKRDAAIAYWAAKRRFGEILVNSADDLMKLATNDLPLDKNPVK